jgi:peptidoglycan/LPS O-acetylase OafA/YrhL
MTPASGDVRLRYLDGIRGLASLQVLLNHGLLAFSPGAERSAGLAADGDFAVLLFFVMSGFVLTESFERQRAPATRLLMSRFFRLAIPVAAACVFAYLLLLSMPHAHTAASELAESRFLGGKSVASPVRAMADIFGVTMWTGTSNTTLFAPIAPGLPGTESSVDAPIWSMHVELWGSVLVLGLVLAWRAGTAVAAIALLLAAILTGANAMTLFICGFLIARVVRVPAVHRILESPSSSWFGAILLVGGVLLAGASLSDRASHFSILNPYAWYHPYKAVAALLVFVSVLGISPLQRLLSAPLFAWLGKQSYAIYLLHVPFILTVGSLTFVALREADRALAVATSIAVVCILTLLLAPLFEARIDRLAVNFSRRIRANGLRSAMP